MTCACDSAVVFDQCGIVYDAVFFNNTSGCGAAITHSGDSKDGNKDGPDEEIT
jgi:stress response protein SCP2